MERGQLIAAIAEAPDDLARWSVYADWLLERGDPAGELVSLSLALEQQPDDDLARRLDILTREERWQSPRLAAQAHFWGFELWRGFVRAAKLLGAKDDPPGAEAVHALFADPHASLIERLDLAAHAAATRAVFDEPRRTIKQLKLGLLVRAVKLHQLPSLERLEVYGGGELDHCTLDRLTYLLGPVTSALARELTSSLPMLDTMRMTGMADVDQLEHPRLRRLGAVLDRCSALHDRFVLPALEELDLVVHDLATLAAPRSIFQRPPTSLTRVTLSTLSRDVELRAAFAATPLASQTRHFDLRFPRFD